MDRDDLHQDDPLDDGDCGTRMEGETGAQGARDRSQADMDRIADRLKRIRDNIDSACARAGRRPDKVTLVVVTKTASMDHIKQALRCGCGDLGENRVQHLKQIAADVDQFLAENRDCDSIPPKVVWHMIGHLQRNKVRHVLKITSIIHSVDTLRLAEEINSAAAKMDVCPEILLQVNTSGEPQKYGVPVGAAIHLAEQIVTMPSLRLAGLMTMAPLTMNKDIVRACFARTRELFEEIKGERIATNKFRHLSMGMSQDYEIAVEEGATLLRIGSAIFS